jgi:hypothetical protein
MARGWIHTLHREGQWLNERESEGAIRGKFKTKEEAVKAGRERARRDEVEHLIHNRDGKISVRNSYGRDDPRKPG